MHLIFWYLTTGFIFQIYLSEHDWLHQLCKKFAKETIFNIQRNEKYFLVLLIYQQFNYYVFEKNPIEIIVDKFFVLDFDKICNQIADK